jgi:hypothetical protein
MPPQFVSESVLRSLCATMLDVFAYISNRLEEMKLRSYSIALAETLETTGNSQSLLLTGIGLQRQGDMEASQKVIANAIVASPQDKQVKYAMIQPWLIPLLQGTAPEYIVGLANSLTGPVAAVLQGRFGNSFASRAGSVCSKDHGCIFCGSAGRSP